MTSEVKIGSNMISVWSILAVIGGILAFVALFLPWVKVTWDLGIFGSMDISVSGLDLTGGKFNGESISYSGVSCFPLIIAILGLISVITSILPAFIEKNKEMAVITVLLSLVALVLSIIFLCVGLSSSLFSGNAKEIADYLRYTFSAQAGPILALIGCIIALVGGGLSLKESL